MVYVKSGRYSRKNSAGFTLIELLVALAISAIVLLVLGQFFISTNKTNTIQEKVADTQQGIRASMELMTRDIRMAGLDPEGSASDAGFADNGNDDDNTDTNSIAIVYDYYDDSDNAASDGDCEDYHEYVCYSFDAANERLMQKWSSDGGSTWQSGALTEDGSIESLEFEYFDEDDNAIATPSTNLDDIRIVRVTICGKISGAYAEDLNATYCFSNTVTPRNM